MISTRHLISDISEVPSVWAFEYYCNPGEKLTGQQVKLKSLFNLKDRIPSFVLYCDNGTYLFNDFSTGKKGNFVKLVADLYGLEYFEAILKIIADYNAFLLQNNGEYSVGEFKKHSKYEVVNFTKRPWNNLDAKFWTSFSIDSGTLEMFKVAPLDSYVMHKKGETEPDELIIQGQYIYGYFRADGNLYKVYQPKVKDHKFLKVKNYVQGTDQLTFEKPNLVICSSLKDAMCLTKFGYNIEVVAPDSENTAIRREVIDIYKTKYSAICTLFDNDDPGLKAMQKYKDNFNIPYVHLKLEKDLSDSVKTYGIEPVRKVLHPLLKEALKK